VLEYRREHGGLVLIATSKFLGFLQPNKDREKINIAGFEIGNNLGIARSGGGRLIITIAAA
jgi:hypothetical protein